MKRTFTLLMLCGLINACSKTQPIDVAIERDDAKIKVVAQQSNTSHGIQQTLYSTVELTIGEDGKVRSNEGDVWDTVDTAIEDAARMARASLKASIAALNITDEKQ